MEYIIYILGGVSILLAIGGLSAWTQSGNILLLLSSIVSIVFSIAAIIFIEWWPLVAGFLVNLFLSKR